LVVGYSEGQCNLWDGKPVPDVASRQSLEGREGFGKKHECYRTLPRRSGLRNLNKAEV